MNGSSRIRKVVCKSKEGPAAVEEKVLKRIKLVNNKKVGILGRRVIWRRLWCNDKNHFLRFLPLV